MLLQKQGEVTQEELGVELLLLRVKKRQLRWLHGSVLDVSRSSPGEVFRARPSGMRPREDPGHAEDSVSLCWERLRIPREELEETCGSGSLGFSAQSCLCDPAPDKAEQNGWIWNPSILFLYPKENKFGTKFNVFAINRYEIIIRSYYFLIKRFKSFNCIKHSDCEKRTFSHNINMSDLQNSNLPMFSFITRVSLPQTCIDACSSTEMMTLFICA